jgi:hypothetical protein
MRAQKSSKDKISAVFEFTATGRLKAVYLNAQNEEDQDVLERGLNRIINPSHLGWFKRLFKK